MNPVLATAWDARAEASLAVFIRRYLAENPPPRGAHLPADLDRWADQLDTDSRALMATLGCRRLEVAR